MKGMKQNFQETSDLISVCEERVRKTESSSVNGNCSARGLALLASAMSQKGVHNGNRILSESAWEAMHANATDGNMIMDVDFPFTQGEENDYDTSCMYSDYHTLHLVIFSSEAPLSITLSLCS